MVADHVVEMLEAAAENLDRFLPRQKLADTGWQCGRLHKQTLSKRIQDRGSTPQWQAIPCHRELYFPERCGRYAHGPLIATFCTGLKSLFKNHEN